jgi:inorganic pyrophosphatase
LPPFDEASGALNIIVKTPKNARIKYKYNDFVPLTMGGDGDPLDVLVLSDEDTFPGRLVRGRFLGALPAEQREGKKVNGTTGSWPFRCVSRAGNG